MKKTYVNAMLQVVSIKKNDILTTSTLNVSNETTDVQLGAERYRDWED